MKKSEERKQIILKLFRARDWLTALILICGLLITYKIWESAQRVADQSMHTVFDFRVKDLTDRLQERLGLYGQVLRAGAGLFAVSHDVSRNDFALFFQTLGLAANYPGVQGIGFARQVLPEELAAHVAAIRRQGFPDYQIWPAGKRELYTSVLYLEPFSGRNLRAFGYDMYTNLERRVAMSMARDTGALTATGKVRLVQEDGAEEQAGFLMYMPVYRDGVLPDTIERRRKELLGWVYAPFRVNDFMRGVGEFHEDDIDIEIYDGDDIAGAHRLYDDNPGHDATDPRRLLRSVTSIEAANHRWLVAIAVLPEREQQLRSDRPQLLLQAGVSISLLVALLTWLFLDDRARALQAADQALQLALYDTLTGLPNRKLLEERLQQTLAHARRHHGRAALLFIDLDRFKPINDTFGHAHGDLLLKEVAVRLQSCMRESDTASRLGGDEFVVLLSEVESRRGVEVVAGKILAELNKSYEIAGQGLTISASIGAAIYPEHGEHPKQLMQSADLAMYQAKHAGRATVRFASSTTPTQQRASA